MARKQLDREQVIADSTELFWRQGYSGSSMQQVLKATGLNPGSLYLAFGNKEGLYAAALDYYGEGFRSRVRAVLDAAPSVGLGLCRLFMEMLDQSARTGFSSCFLIKSQLELSVTGSDLMPVVRRNLEQVETLYIDYLRRDYPEPQARQHAASLLMQSFGLQVYAHLNPCRDTVIAALKLGLPWLPWGDFDTAPPPPE